MASDSLCSQDWSWIPCPPLFSSQMLESQITIHIPYLIPWMVFDSLLSSSFYPFIVDFWSYTVIGTNLNPSFVQQSVAVKNISSREEEAGEPWGLHASQATLLGKLQASERPSLKISSESHSWKSLLACTCMCACITQCVYVGATAPRRAQRMVAEASNSMSDYVHQHNQ